MEIAMQVAQGRGFNKSRSGLVKTIVQKAALAAAILFVGWALLSSAVLAQTPIQISFSPLAMELVGERGSTVPFAISIVNNSRFQTAQFRAYATGLREGRGGDYAPKIPDDGPYAASTWVSFEQDRFDVAPGASYELRGTVTIPRDARPSGYAAVVVELLPDERIGAPALSVEYVQQFVTALEIVVGRRHQRSAHIESMTVVPASSVPELAASYGAGAILFVGSLVNDGDVHITGRGRLVIRDERGRRVREVPLGGGRGVVLPDTVVDFGSVLGGLAPGTYEMQAIVDYGGARPAIGRMEFELGDEAVGISRVVAGRSVRIDAQPDRLQFDFSRPGYRAQTVTVMNRDTVDVDFNVKLVEYVNDEGGDPMLVDPDVVMPYSAVAWGEARPNNFTLRPGQRRNVVIGFRAPEDERGGRYARVLIEGRTPVPQPGVEAATSEILIDSLLVLGTDLAPRMDLSQVEWRPVGVSGRVSVAATVVNEGELHGSAGMRLTMFQFTPAVEEDMGDFVLVTGEEWDIVDGLEVVAEDTVLLPGDERFMFGIFSHVLEPERQYRVLVEVLGATGVRSATGMLHLWMDAAGTIHEGLMEETMEDDQ